MAKGMASAYAPISATVARSGVFEAFLNDPSEGHSYFRDISTYGGCTGGFAAALENLRIIEDEGLIENARIVGEYLLDRLRELSDHPHVGDVRGKGLFAGIELVADKETKEPIAEAVVAGVVAATARRGVLIGKTTRSIPGFNNTINMAPPLIVARSDIDQIVAAVTAGIDEATA